MVTRRTAASLAQASVLTLGLVACDAVRLGDGRDLAPRNVEARYEWLFYGFRDGQPVGQPSVQLLWDLPSDWDGEPFRIYAREPGRRFLLIATVTSCSGGGCRYSDVNVLPGTVYEYVVATADPRTDTEIPSTAVAIRVPSPTSPAAPQDLRVVALDSALFLRWRDGGVGGALWKYLVYLVDVDGQPAAYRVGETDAPAYLDTRVRNGARYTYRVAAVDTFGHVGPLSGAGVGIPRPDASWVLLWARADDELRSGFRFPSTGSGNPIVAGGSPAAQWRLDSDGPRLLIVPLQGTEVAGPLPSSALACGPGSDPSCQAVERAPATGWSVTPVAVDVGATYVFRVRGDDSRLRYGKVRIELAGRDDAGRRFVVLSWAYQLRPEEPSLLRSSPTEAVPPTAHAPSPTSGR